jgi:hypothetical protein
MLTVVLAGVVAVSARAQADEFWVQGAEPNEAAREVADAAQRLNKVARRSSNPGTRQLARLAEKLSKRAERLENQLGSPWGAVQGQRQWRELAVEYRQLHNRSGVHRAARGIPRAELSDEHR